MSRFATAPRPAAAPNPAAALAAGASRPSAGAPWTAVLSALALSAGALSTPIPPAVALSVAGLGTSAMWRPAPAQEPVDLWRAEPDELQELRLEDGSVLVGRLVELGDPVRFELASGGVLEVRRARIRGLRTVEGEIRDGEVWRPDPSSNRLFFGPTGRTIGRGRGYFAVFEAVLPSLSVGIHDRATIGAGTLLFGDLDAARPFWFLPKLKVVDQEELAASVGALAVTSVEGGWVGILYGVATVGSPDAALTAGLGYGWVEDDFADTPAVLLGAETRVSRSVKLITENYLIPLGDGDAELLLSAGPRFFGDRLSADLGIAMFPSGEGFFPLVNFVYNW